MMTIVMSVISVCMMKILINCVETNNLVRFHFETLLLAQRVLHIMERFYAMRCTGLVRPGSSERLRRMWDR